MFHLVDKHDLRGLSIFSDRPRQENISKLVNTNLYHITDFGTDYRSLKPKPFRLFGSLLEQGIRVSSVYSLVVLGSDTGVRGDISPSLSSERLLHWYTKPIVPPCASKMFIRTRAMHGNVSETPYLLEHNPKYQLQPIGSIDEPYQRS
jgi:hypothetical protein